MGGFSPQKATRCSIARNGLDEAGVPRDVNGRSLITVAVVAVSLGACGGDELVHEAWRFEGEPPRDITVPIAPGGELASALDGPERSVVMMMYEGYRFDALVEQYDAWADDAFTRTEQGIIAEDRAVVVVRWASDDVEVRITECLDILTREFTQACVAISQVPPPATARHQPHR